MPLTYNYKCSLCGSREVKGKILQGECDFVVRDTGPYQILQINGKEEILPHPLEEDKARSLTGKTLDQLAKEGRVFYKRREFCLKCLNIEDKCSCKKPSFLEISELEGMECPKCHKGKILKSQAGIT